jgi:hypothetical protein
MAKWEGGKGSNPRPMKVSKSRFEENWDLAFSKKDKQNKKPEKEKCEQKQEP